MKGIIEDVFEKKRKMLSECGMNPENELWITLLIGNINHLEGMIKDALKEAFPNQRATLEVLIGDIHDCMDKS